MSSAPNLLNLASNDFSGDTLNRVAGALGENSSSIQSALGGVIPALIFGLADKASTTQSAGDLVNLFRNNKLDTGELTAASALSSGDGISRTIETGQPLVNSIFGTRSSGVIDWTSSLGGLKKSSATSLLSLGAPVVMALIARQLRSSGGVNAPNLMSLLAGQRQYLAGAPAGLSGLLALDTGATHVGTYAAERAAPVAATQGSSWWKWLLPLLALAAILAYFLFRQPAEAPVVTVSTPTPTLTPVTAPTVTARLGDFVDARLPNGTVLHIPSMGVESKLLAFIQDPARMVDKETWFSFDRLEFATDSATLLPKSEEQLQNINEILKAYPKVKLKIGGYTDNVGPPAHNMKLSTDRATNTMKEIVTLGTAATRLAAEGYGEEHPVADNSTEEGRQRNRRIDVRVTAK